MIKIVVMFRKILILIFLLSGISIYSQVVINEIDVDMTGSDVNEFIELKSTTPNFSLDGYVLVLYNETNSLSYYAIDLDGYSTDINGIFLSGNTAVSPAPTLVIPNGKIQNGPDVIALYQANATDFPDGTLATSTNLVNAIAYSTAAATATNLMAILGLTVSTNENMNGLATTQSIQRKNDGTYEVKTPTPGMNNDGSGIILNYITVSTSQTNYNEGDVFDFVFTTSQPVTGSDLLFNFTLVNGNFMVNDYTNTNLTVLIPVGQNTASNTCTLFNDITDEGDEELLIDIQSVPTGYVINNDNLILRVYDNDYVVQTFGTPINPTYNIVTPTIPTGYYDSLEGLSGNALKQAVQDIIAAPTVRLHSYADIWDIIRTADQNPENSNQIWDMYLEIPMAKLDQQTTSSIVGKWNREHIFCQSRGGFEVANGDTADGIGIWNSTSAASVVDGVSIEVNQGEIVGLLGPNGAGKTTSFYVIVGLIRPNEGTVFLDEIDITKVPMYKRAQMGIGYLPQEVSVFRKLSVEDNIMAILEMTDLKKPERKIKLEKLLTEFNLVNVRKNIGDKLSGGEKRRTEIARALATDPKFVLLDEPFAGVDPIAVEDIQSIISELKKRNIGILITDHNVQETLSITDRAYLLFEGKILKSGTAEELAADEQVRKVYLGQNFVLRN